MKKYHVYLLIGVIMLIGFALLPLTISAFSEEFSWENFKSVYDNIPIFLPIISK